MSQSHQAEIIKLLGNMDLNSDPTEIGDGFYRYAKNIVQTRDNVGTSKSTKATLGNQYVIDIGSVSQQNKRYRIYFPDNQDYDIRVDISHPSGGGVGFTFTFAQAPVGNNLSAINFKSQADAFFISQSQTHVTVLGDGYVDVEWGEYAMMDYTLSVTHRVTGDDRYDCVVIREAISVDLSGNLIPIQSFDLNGDLFIWSTTQRNLPKQITAEVTNIGPVSGGTYIGPLTLITFNAPHGLVQGQRIEITHSLHYWMNGVFIVSSVPSPTQINIPTELVWSGASAPLMPPGTTGSERVFIHPEGIGEIGVFKEDRDSNTYSYFRLIRSKEFNFRTPWTIDMPTVKKNNYRTSMYWTDGAQSQNPPRAAYQLGDYSVDCMLGHVNIQDGMYWLGRINEATFHVPPQSRAYAEYSDQLQDGGSITAGNKRYSVRLLNRFLVGTGWSIPSPAIPVFKAPNSATTLNRVVGSEAGSLTGKINILNIMDVDRYTYDFIELSVIEYGDNSTVSSTVIKRVPTRQGNIGSVLHPTLQLRHDGYEQTSPIAISDLTDLSSEIFDRAGNMSVLDSRMILSDLSKNADFDLTNWAKTFQHRIMRKPIGTVFPEGGIGEYQVIDNCVNYVGYMDNETYRIGVMLRRRDNGKWTKVYLIDDLTTDAFVDNLGNPSDNRRDQTGGSSAIGELKSDWGLTTDWITNGPITENSTGSITYATYFELFGADLRTNIDGKPIRQVFDRIRFVRPETVEQVLCTGLAVMSVAVRNHYMPDWTTLANGSANADTSSGLLDRSKILIKGEIQGRGIIEFPLFASVFTRPVGSYETTYTLASFPVSAGVGLGFGKTMCTSGTNTIVFDGAPQSQTRQSFVAHPNILSFYSPDLLSDSIDSRLIQNGSYKIRSLANGHSSVRNGVQDIARWGRAKNSWSEFHPYPIQTPATTDPTLVWKDFDVVRSQKVARGEDAELDSFDYTLTGQFLANIGAPISSSQFFSGTYRRFIDAVNIAAGQTWGTVTTPVSNGLQFIDSAWNLSDATMIQTPHDNDGLGNPRYPKIDFFHGNSGADNSTSGTPFSIPFNHATFYAQIVRDIDDPYGDEESTIYRHICAEFEITPSGGVIQKEEFPIFGGDTFAQSTYVKNRYINEATREGQAWGDWDAGFSGSVLNDGMGEDGRPGFGSVVKIYSQNRINSQMRYTDDTQFIFLGDTTDRTTFVEETDRLPDLFTYSDSYTPKLLTSAFAPFQKSLPVRDQSPARFTWSEAAIEDGLSDGYRNIPPLNIKDLDLTEGKITWHRKLNGELVSWQRNTFMRQFFNAAGTLQVAEGQINVSIGDGAVMKRQGVTLSMFGSSHREAIIYGRSNGGKHVAYWFNAAEFQFCRFGADGLVAISERQSVYSWIRDNAKWVIDENSPYEMYGIRGVWDKAYSEAIWTFTGRRKAPEWETGRGVSSGVVKFSPNASPTGFHQLPDLYRSLTNHTSSSLNEPGVGADWQDFWEIIPHTDPEHYTEFSIAWNEVKNGFSCFYTPMPRIYMPWNDTFLTTHPTVNSSLFLHRRGERLKWWELNGVALTDTAYLEAVHNTVPDDTKRYVAIQVASDTAPDRLELETYNQESYLDAVEFTGVNDPTSSHTWRSPIKGDSTATGLNTGNLMMRGEYMIIKLIFNALSNNAVRSFVLKYYGRGRKPKN